MSESLIDKRDKRSKKTKIEVVSNPFLPNQNGGTKWRNRGTRIRPISSWNWKLESKHLDIAKNTSLFRSGETCRYALNSINRFRFQWRLKIENSARVPPEPVNCGRVAGVIVRFRRYRFRRSHAAVTLRRTRQW